LLGQLCVCSLLPLSVGDEGVVEGKERVPSPADNDAVRFSNY